MKLNEEICLNWREETVKKAFILQQHRERLAEEAVFRKSQIEIKDHKLKFFNLMRWSIIKQERIGMEQAIEVRKEKRLMLTNWLKKVQVHQVITHIYNVFTSAISFQNLKMKKFMSSIKIRSLFLRYLYKLRAGKRPRQSMWIRNCLIFKKNVLDEQQAPKASLLAH